MFKVDVDFLAESLYDANEERYSEDAPQDLDVKKALNECIDFEKLNSMIPKLWYPNGKFQLITKADLLEFIN
jgi:chemotaxis methyl-accepting protein methylase